MAANPDHDFIINDIRAFIDRHQGRGSVRSFAEYWAELAQPSDMDTAEVMFIKGVLQHGLPEVMRNELVRNLFERFVPDDPSVLAAELYMTPEQLRTMIRCGMYVGSHGAGHYRLDHLDAASQASEIDASLHFLKVLGAPTDDWVMCYPWGVYDDKLLALLKSRGCAIGLTTTFAVAQLDTDNPLELPRLDTNHLPH